MGCTPAPACVAARKQASALAPGRSQASDGICGDEAHQARKSDHNAGEAVDLTHDPGNGFDAHSHARAIAARRDPRVKYIISERRIWNPDISSAWRPYDGSNPHEKHFHMSIHRWARDDTSAWFDQEEDDLTGTQSQKLDDLHAAMTAAKTDRAKDSLRLDAIEKRQGELKARGDAILEILRTGGQVSA